MLRGAGAMPVWDEAVKKAVARHVAITGSPLFTRQELIASEIGAIAADTRTTGRTPTQTLGRELQQLRDAGLIEFVERGTYRWLGLMPEPVPVSPSKGIFMLPHHPGFDDLPERRYRFGSQWLRTAARLAGQWVVYQGRTPAGAGGYHAAARVEQIDPASDRDGLMSARIAEGSYLEFGRLVPFEIEGAIVEYGLLSADLELDDDRALQPVRAISDADFNRIIELGLVTEDELLPRTDLNDGLPIAQQLAEERAGWEGPVDRATMLVNRKVRNHQFRKRVLDVYGARCALTGMKLINGGGRPETEAAHIMSVSAGGPDAVNNGIALSGTIHWMFDRGLISLSDHGDILLSGAINDRDSVERLIFPDRKARFPAASDHRPHPHYLDWHRTECFHH